MDMIKSIDSNTQSNYIKFFPQSKQSEEELCQNHNKKLEAYCLEDQMLLCIDCIINTNLRSDNNEKYQNQRNLQNNHHSHTLVSIEQGVSHQLILMEQQAEQIQNELQPIVQQDRQRVSIIQRQIKSHYDLISINIKNFFDQIRKKLDNQQRKLQIQLSDKLSILENQLTDIDSDIDANTIYQEEYLSHQRKIIFLADEEQLTFLSNTKKLAKLYQRIRGYFEPENYRGIHSLIDQDPIHMLPNFNYEKEQNEIVKLINENNKPRSVSPVSNIYNSVTNLSKQTSKMFSNRQSFNRKSFIHHPIYTSKDQTSAKTNKNQLSTTKIMSPEETLMHLLSDDKRDRLESSIPKNPIQPFNIKQSLTSIQFTQASQKQSNPNKVQNQQSSQNLSRYLNQKDRDTSYISKNSQSVIKSTQKSTIYKKMMIKTSREINQPQHSMITLGISSSNLKKSTKVKNKFNKSPNLNSFLSEKKVNDQNQSQNYATGKLQKTQQILSRLSLHHTSQQAQQSNKKRKSQGINKAKKSLGSKLATNENQISIRKDFKNVQSPRLNGQTGQTFITNNGNTSILTQNPLLSQLSIESPSNEPNKSLAPHEAAVSYQTFSLQEKTQSQAYQMKINRNPFKSLQINIPENKRGQNKFYAQQIDCKNLIESTEGMSNPNQVETQFEDINFTYNTHTNQSKQSQNLASNDEGGMANEISDEISSDLEEESINKIKHENINFRTYQCRVNNDRASVQWSYQNSEMVSGNQDDSDSSQQIYQKENTLIQDYFAQDQAQDITNSYQPQNETSYNL
ncbi:kelch motif family protein [Stylonychia lemnae]|uniref:Kelch motif family protein n=1 Tax=Stylonychia lemnae TaxID=5949 RepID=A0A078AP02_STYLE|nr:kelch motif family protein [Stylonychia lemnae]|eukprot:CDW83042.1 kelch motif family protein [Stylonychia lemnae]